MSTLEELQAAVKKAQAKFDERHDEAEKASLLASPPANLAALKEAEAKAERILKEAELKVAQAKLEAALRETPRDDAIVDAARGVVKAAEAAVEAATKVLAVKRLRLTQETNGAYTHIFAKLSKATLSSERKALVFDTDWISLDKVVFERMCYKQLFDKVMAKLDIKEYSRNVVVTGSPGTGKTLFGCYCLTRLLSLGYTVIYIHKTWKDAHLYLPAKPAREVLQLLLEHEIEVPMSLPAWLGHFVTDIDSGLNGPPEALYSALTRQKGQVVVILDPPKSMTDTFFPIPPCGSLTVASPGTLKRSTFSIKSEGMNHDLYMPLWDLAELKELLKSRLAEGEEPTQQALDELESRVLRFGTIPRHVAHASESHEDMMYRVRHAVDLALREFPSTMNELLNPESANPDVSGLLVHMVVNDKFEYLCKRFASKLVERLIFSRYYRTERRNLSMLLKATDDMESFIKAGEISERAWKTVLQGGGKFHLQELLPSNLLTSTPRGPVREINLPATEMRFSDRKELDDVGPKVVMVPAPGEAGVFLDFLVKTVAAVDALLCLPTDQGEKIFGSDWAEPAKRVEREQRSKTKAAAKPDTAAAAGPAPSPMVVMALQMTINTNHGINAEGLLKAFLAAGRGCGATPPVFHFVFVTSVERGRHFMWTGLTGTHHSDPRLAKIRQWVLTVDNEVLAEFTKSS